MTYLVAQIVTFGSSVKRLQGVALLHKNLPVNSEFGAMCSCLSATQFPFGCTDVVVDPRSRAALSDTPGFHQVAGAYDIWTLVASEAARV